MRAKKRKNSKQFNERFRKRFFTKKAVLVIVCAAAILVVAAFACQSQRKRAAGLRETVEELSTEIRDLEDAKAYLGHAGIVVEHYFRLLHGLSSLSCRTCGWQTVPAILNRHTTVTQRVSNGVEKNANACSA